MKYDIIGDIHGHANKLISLLDKLGYQKLEGIYQQEDRQAIFVGDFIDRGEQQKKVIEIVRPMIDEGKALAVMGNHEFNAICYHTSSKGSDNQYLREHNKKNTGQHEAFLKEYPLDQTETADLINWFKTLPLFLELEDKIRVVHACWDEHIIEDLRSKDYLNENKSLKNEYFFKAAEKGHELYDAVNILLKGKEITLPSGCFFYDKDGNKRYEIRIKWWEKNLKTYQQASILEIDSLKNQADIKLPDSEIHLGYPDDEIPVFFGHYWFSGEVQSISNNVACLDFSAAKCGPLVAYRWEGKHFLQGKNFLASNFIEFSLNDVIEAHKNIDNQKEIERSAVCGCFYCLSIFTAKEIESYDQGIKCPRCGTESVIGDNPAYPLNREFLAAMHRHWF